jgi:hypothetical protein
VSPLKPIKPGPQLERLMHEDPERLVFPLGYFINKFSFDAQDIHRELAAGRLVAETDAAGERAIARGKAPKVVVISLAAVRAWLRHPQTPLRLIEKIITAQLSIH